MKNKLTLNNNCLKEVRKFYKKGEGLKSKKLKNYTSGDGDNLGMEKMVETLIYQVIDDLGIDRSRVHISDDYFNPSDVEAWDPQRMDFHIKIDDEFPIIVESRAWIDKPFYTLKRAVTRNMMKLTYVRRRLAKDVQFAYVGLAIDVKDRLITSMDKTQGFGDRVSMFKFSPHRRNYKKGNYFDHGVNDQGVIDFVEFLQTHLAKYAKEE